MEVLAAAIFGTKLLKIMFTVATLESLGCS
jgi:hypothetical protein